MLNNNTTTVHRLSHDGRGIATVDQKTVFIVGALPEEMVTFKVIKKHRRYLEAEAMSIRNESPLRQTPPCPHFSQCGGCNLQHMADAAELQFKQQLLIEQLQTLGSVTPDIILPPLSAQTLGYRRKARLGVRWVKKKNKLLIGFRERSGRYLADLSGCVVLHPKVGEQFEALRTLILSLSIAHNIPQIEIAIGDEQTALIFRHMQPLLLEDEERLKQFGEQYHFDIYTQPNPPLPLKQLWQTGFKERLTYSLPDEALTFLFHPLDFTQVHLEVNRLMVAKALSLLEIKKDETVLDLYCGIGNFTLPLAKRAKQVTGVEGSQEMVRRAKENAQFNQIDNVDFWATNLDDANLMQQNASWINAKYDKILIDPPRVGAKNVLTFIEQWQPQRIVYISCNPSTLARDAKWLTENCKYRLHQAGIMNMFPQTSHVEVIAVFNREE